jgi:hypothetical protein
MANDYHTTSDDPPSTWPSFWLGFLFGLCIGSGLTLVYLAMLMR